MIKDKALKLALEALSATETNCGSRAWERETEAVALIKEALAAPVMPLVLTGQQRTLLGQAWVMLEHYAQDQRFYGNDDFANGAEASAHEIKKMLIYLTKS
jgi:hypothetical protein